MMKLISYSVLISMMAGCQSKEAASTSSQVVAKVNGDEITVHQLNAELQHIKTTFSSPEAVSKKVLDGLIDRQLLVQEAVKLNLDRSTEVQQLVDAAKAQIYAQAYLARKSSRTTSATDSEINAFIQQHPALFNQRKVFETTDVVFANNPSKVDYEQLQAQVANLEDLKNWLQANHIAYDEAEEKLPSEALPTQAVTMLESIKVGDLLFMRDDLKVIVRSVTHISDSPLNAKQSVDMATRIINERKRQQLIQEDLSRLRKLSRIDYLNKQLTLEPSAENSHTH